MALSRAMKNLMHDRAQQGRAAPSKVTPSVQPQRSGMGGMLQRLRAKQSQQGATRGAPKQPGQAKGIPGMMQRLRGAQPEPGASRGVGGMVARAAPRPREVQGEPGKGTFGFASRTGGRGGFDTTQAEISKPTPQVAARPVQRRRGPTPARRGGGAFGSRAYLR